MVAHFDSAVERNRDFRHSVQDLDSSLSRLGAQTAFAFPPYTWRFLAPVFSMQFSL
jgi:hypothetical protein